MNNMFSRSRNQNRPTSQDNRLPKPAPKDPKTSLPAVPLRALLRDTAVTQPAATGRTNRTRDTDQSVRSNSRPLSRKLRFDEQSQPATSSRRPSESALDRISGLDYDATDFKKVESQFFDLISKDFKVLCNTLEPKTEQGRQLITNGIVINNVGLFWSCWGKVLKRNAYINTNSYFSDLCKNHYSKLSANKDHFERFMMANGIDAKLYANEGKQASNEKKDNVAVKKQSVGKQSAPKSAENKKEEEIPKASEPANNLSAPEATNVTLNDGKRVPGNPSPKKMSVEKRDSSPSPKKGAVKNAPSPSPSPSKRAATTTATVAATNALAAQSSPKPKSFIERMREARNASKPEQTPAVGYPDLGDIKDFMAKKENDKKKLLSTSDSFVVDFFEINDIYKLSELSIVAVLESDYKELGLYSVALAKKASEKDIPNAEEFLVIESLSETV
jgi:hypothetical protein